MAKTKKKRKFDVNLIIALGVLLASIGALIISTKQATIMNRQTEIFLEQSKASSWPSLSIGMSRTVKDKGLEKYYLAISNRGTGPAIVEQTRIFYDGQPVANWADFYETINVPDSIRKSHGNDILINRVVKANEDFLLVDWSYNPALMNFIHERSDKIKIEICYKSVFGDRWLVKRTGFKSNLERTETAAVEACSTAEGKVFLE